MAPRPTRLWLLEEMEKQQYGGYGENYSAIATMSSAPPISSSSSNNHPMFGIVLIVMLLIFFLMFFFSVYIRRGSCLAAGGHGSSRSNSADGGGGAAIAIAGAAERQLYYNYLEGRHSYGGGAGLSASVGLDPDTIAKLLPIVRFDSRIPLHHHHHHHHHHQQQQQQPPPSPEKEMEKKMENLEMVSPEKEKNLMEMEKNLMENLEMEMCAVCLVELEDGEPVRLLPNCRHCFHPSCIDMWLFSHFTCPICRRNAVHLLQLVEAGILLIKPPSPPEEEEEEEDDDDDEEEEDQVHRHSHGSAVQAAELSASPDSPSPDSSDSPDSPSPESPHSHPSPDSPDLTSPDSP